MAAALETTTDDVVLDVRDLRVRAGRSELVHGVDLTIRAHERVGLIGASGSGKTLTSMAIAGLLGDGIGPRPSDFDLSGSVRLRGVPHDILCATEAALTDVRGRAIGMVFQEPMSALNPTMRVGRQVAEAVLAHGGDSSQAARARSLEMLRLCGFPNPERIDRSYPHQLSGGQLQRVVLSIALINKPSLLICDEPTTALDVTVQATVLELISAQVDSVGTALLFISHDLAVVASICDRLIVMHRGEIVEQGAVVDVLENPQHEHTRRLMADTDLDPIRATALGEETP